MKPIDRDLPRSLTLMRATLLASALATISTSPSGVRHRLEGVLPAGDDGYSAQWIVSTGLPSAASSTSTRVELAQATYSVLPSGDSAISVGWLSVFHVASRRSLVRSMTATAAVPHRLTNRRLPSLSGRQS